MMRTIIVFFDSLNKRYLPVYNPCCDTIAPNFTRLAEHSAMFQNSYVGSMPCIPARRELHTGRYNFLHREWGPLEVFDDSMPELLKNHGIYTHLISDHLHYWEDGGATYHSRYSSWEMVRGQEGDHWKGQIKQPAIPPVVKIPTRQNGTGVSKHWRYDWINRQYIKDELEFPQTRCFLLGCEFIEKNRAEDNWLLHLETFDPHEPFYVPQTYLDLYPNEYKGKHFDWPCGEAEEQEAETSHCIRQYQALVSMCDSNLGKVLDRMDHYDMWEDTMLIVGTDHGFLLSEHGYWGKNQMPYYNENACTPLFIWDPRSKVRGKKRKALVQMIDWAPTILDYFQVPIPHDMQGKSLKHAIKNDDEVRQYALFGLFGAHINITDGRYVYMRAPLPQKEQELYHYTLVPQRMNERFHVEELQGMTLNPPFSFTKGCSVLKIKGNGKQKASSFGTLLFDLEQDPEQMFPIQDSRISARMMQAMKEEMINNDCPPEQFDRVGI